jgi:hypothetical protein
MQITSIFAPAAPALSPPQPDAPPPARLDAKPRKVGRRHRRRDHERVHCGCRRAFGRPEAQQRSIIHNCMEHFRL